MAFVNSCPHYPPAGATGTSYVCRGCGSEVSNPNHPNVQALGQAHQGAGSILSAPAVKTAPRRPEAGRPR